MRSLIPIGLTLALAVSSAAYAQEGEAVPADTATPPVETAVPLEAAPIPIVESPPAEAPTPIIFADGTGDPTAVPLPYSPPPVMRTRFACSALPDAGLALLGKYAGESLPATRLDKGLLAKALDSYRQHHCATGQSGPSLFVVVDFAKRSSQPRLWYVDLVKLSGIDEPILVTHGNGSDPDSDGYADRFSNIYDSRMSSLGALRGGERYHGRNGLSLRLDGLEPGNNMVRYRDIVVHTVRESNRSYFGYETRARLNGAIGVSDGCFVVERHERERLLATLENGGFLYAGIGTLDPGRSMPETILVWPPRPIIQPALVGDIVFMPGTGVPAPDAAASIQP